MIEILNRQAKIQFKAQHFQNFIENAAKELFPDNNISVTIAFIDDTEMTSINNKFRNQKKTTDVLSFPVENEDFDLEDNYIGDIIISAEQAERQAIENSLSIELEFKQLILHGFLHLKGFDHETDNGEMNELELEFRDKLGIM